MWRFNRGLDDCRTRTRPWNEDHGRQHDRNQSGNGAGIYSWPALRCGRFRRPDFPRARSRPRSDIPGRLCSLRWGGLGLRRAVRRMTAEKTWFGQPRGLTILFLTNMWELFSYYGMRTLLVYYMTKQLLFAQEKSSLIYGTYTALAYFTPILGGAIADRWLGKRRSVIIGATVMALGHFMICLLYTSPSPRDS